MRALSSSKASIVSRSMCAEPHEGRGGWHRRKGNAASDFERRAVQCRGQKADRVGFKVLEDGKKVRIFKSSGEVVDA